MGGREKGRDNTCENGTAAGPHRTPPITSRGAGGERRGEGGKRWEVGLERVGEEGGILENDGG